MPLHITVFTVSFLAEVYSLICARGHTTELAVFVVIGEVKLTQPSTVRLPSQLGQLD